jgi:hypothetical protein
MVDFGVKWFIVVVSLLWGNACKTGVFPQFSALQTLSWNHFWEQEVGGSNSLAPNWFKPIKQGTCGACGF